jgi:hypothetical protein
MSVSRIRGFAPRELRKGSFTVFAASAAGLTDSAFSLNRPVYPRVGNPSRLCLPVRS